MHIANFIRHPGFLTLRRWGLLDRVEAICPPIRRVLTDWGDFPLHSDLPSVEGNRVAYAIRRRHLDRILREAALEAGVEFREAFSVEDLLFDGDRVVGIRGRSAGREPVVEHGRLVIGGAVDPNSSLTSCSGKSRAQART